MFNLVLIKGMFNLVLKIHKNFILVFLKYILVFFYDKIGHATTLLLLWEEVEPSTSHLEGK